jgi:hypothetical protein
MPSLKKHLSASLSKHPDITDILLSDQWKHLIVEPLTNLEGSLHQTRLLIVIDALDECDGDDDVRAILRLLSEAQIITAVQLRVFVTSRPEMPIRLGFNNMASILHHDLILNNVSRDTVNRDISAFFKQQFSEISEVFKGISSDWPGLERIKTLVQKSDGLFIYAATVCRFIRNHDQSSPEALLRAFIPKGSSNRPRKRIRKEITPKALPFLELDKIYTHILEHSLKGIKGVQYQEDIAREIREVISTIAILFQPQSVTTLSYMLDMDQSTIQLRLKHLRSLLSIPDDSRSPIRTLHPSFRDFLFDNKRCLSYHFSSDESADHIRLSKLCFDILSEHLKQDICNVQRSGISASNVEKSVIQRAIPPEVEYACTYWIQHVVNSRVKLQDDHWISGFLRSHVLYWFEALSWIGRLSDGIHALSALELKTSVGVVIFPDF